MISEMYVQYEYTWYSYQISYPVHVGTFTIRTLPVQYRVRTGTGTGTLPNIQGTVQYVYLVLGTYCTEVRMTAI